MQGYKIQLLSWTRKFSAACPIHERIASDARPARARRTAARSLPRWPPSLPRASPSGRYLAPPRSGARCAIEPSHNPSVLLTTTRCLLSHRWGTTSGAGSLSDGCEGMVVERMCGSGALRVMAGALRVMECEVRGSGSHDMKGCEGEVERASGSHHLFRFTLKRMKVPLFTAARRPWSVD
jgi:hypothetical protein